MGRSLDTQQQEELTAFVNALAEAAGYTTSAEWARDSGYAYPNLTKLRAGKGAVDGYNLLRLLRAAAARSEMTPEQLALGIARATAEDASEASIARRLDELADAVGETLEILRAGQPSTRRQAPVIASTGPRKRASR